MIRDPGFRVVFWLSAIVLFLPLTWPLATGRVFGYWDLGAFNIPLRYEYQNALRHGDSVLWTSNLFSGFYIHGEGQGGFFHPVHQVLYRVFPLGIGLNLEMLAGYIGGFAGMYVFLRRLRLRTEGRLFGSLLFGFSGFTLMHYDNPNLVIVFVHIPWLLAAIDVVIAANHRGAVAAGYAAVAALLASAILFGFPQGAWWSLLTGAGFAVLRASSARRWRRLVPIAFAIGTGLLIGGVQLLPTLDMAAGSIRPLVPRTFALEFSLHPLNVIQFWSPYGFVERFYEIHEPHYLREFGAYSAAILLVALPWIWVRRRSLERERLLIVRAALAFAALSLVLAFGRYGGLYPALTHLPVLGTMRAPARYVGLVQLSLIVIAAIAVDDLLAFGSGNGKISRRDVVVLCIPAALSLATTLAFNALPFARHAGLPFSSLPRAAVGTALMAAVTACMILTARRTKWGPAALVLVTAIDLGLWGVRETWRTPPQTLASLTERIPPPGPGDERNVYVLDPELPGNLATMKGYRLATGYVGLPPRTNYHISSIVSLQLSGTHYHFSLAGGKEPIPDPVARVRLLTRAEVTDSFYRDFARVDLHEAALIDRPIEPLTGPPGDAHVVVDRPGDITVDTEAPGRQLLASSERYYPGWRATVDGEETAVVAVHGDFVGCVVAPGRHRVRFWFAPRSFGMGVWTTFAGLAALFVAVAAIARFGRTSLHR